MHHGHGSGWLSHDSMKQVGMATNIRGVYTPHLTLWASALAEDCHPCPILPLLAPIDTAMEDRHALLCFADHALGYWCASLSLQMVRNRLQGS